MNYASIKVVSAEGDYIYDAADTAYLDLCMGYGAVSLGHSYKSVAEAVCQQLHRYSSPGFITFDTLERLKSVLEEFVPGNYIAHGLYTSGALAVEHALKLAIISKNKTGIIGFENSMHGRTIASTQLGSDAYYSTLSNINRLPLPSSEQEDDVLKQYKAIIEKGKTCAVIIEPIQMSAGGNKASNRFYEEVIKISKDNAVLVIFDEILTGCYRSGTKFFSSQLKYKPDIVLLGKSIGNGFPVAAVMYNIELTLSKDMKLGGTYFNNPLSCAAVISTLTEIKAYNCATLVSNIEKTVIHQLSGLTIKGQGALWCIELDSPAHMNYVVNSLFKDNIIVSYYDKYIRLLPGYFIEQDVLNEACATLKRSV